jgi:hypothetical protein
MKGDKVMKTVFVLTRFQASDFRKDPLAVHDILERDLLNLELGRDEEERERWARKQANDSSMLVNISSFSSTADLEAFPSLPFPQD